MDGAVATLRDAEPITATRVVLFDGVCGLCDKTVQVLLRLDKREELRFAPLQGETAAAFREKHAEIPQDLDTVVFVDEGKVYLRSRAFTRIARYLPFPWRAAALFAIVPAFVLDLVYRLVARSRYRIFGKHDVCRVPSPAERARFLA